MIHYLYIIRPICQLIDFTQIQRGISLCNHPHLELEIMNQTDTKTDSFIFKEYQVKIDRETHKDDNGDDGDDDDDDNVDDNANLIKHPL